MTFALRDYQESAVVDVRSEIGRHRAVLLVLATGAGKTVIFSYIAKSAAFKGKKVLILAHRDQLIKQASKKLQEYGVPHGIIMAGMTPDRYAPVQVGSVQTLARRLDKLRFEFDLIVIDEAHLSSAKSYRDICAKWPNAKILGVTGSPIRLDGKGLGVDAGGLFNIMVEGVSIKDLIEMGWLVRPVVYAPSQSLDLSGVKMTAGDYNSDELAKIVDKPKITGSAVEQYAKICPNVPAVAWCVTVEHAMHVADQFNQAGIRAQMLSGESSSDERSTALAKLETGELKVITFCMLLVEGVDCPAIGAVILLRPTKSLSAYLQTIGRGLRPLPGKSKCYILDHAGLYQTHGFADEVREWSLDGRKKKKAKAKDDDEKLQFKQCPKCYGVHSPAPVCAHCGHQYEVLGRTIEEVDGQLHEITPAMAAAMKRDKQREVSKARTLEELKVIAAQRGYANGWASAVFSSRSRTKAVA